MAKLMKSGPACGCGPADFVWMVVAAGVKGLALLLLVNGVYNQWMGGMNAMVWAWYLAGFTALILGCCLYKKIGKTCPVHK